MSETSKAVTSEEFIHEMKRYEELCAQYNEKFMYKVFFRIGYGPIKPRIYPLYELPYTLQINCEIHELIKDGDEIFLGVMTKRALQYISIELVDYAIKNYEEKKIKSAEKCIDLCRKRFDGDLSISDESLDNASQAACNNNSTISLAAAALAQLFIQTEYVYFNRELGDIIDFTSGATELAGQSNIPVNEAIRIGKFIVDFMKSDKYLFMV